MAITDQLDHIQDFVAEHREAARWLAVIGVTGVILGAGIVFGGWLVSIQTFPSWMGLQGKTAWDFAGLLLVPSLLAIIAYLFSTQQKQVALKTAKAARRTAIYTAAEERQSNVSIAHDHAEEQALQSYVARMSDLVLQQDLRGKASEQNAEGRSVAQSLTLATLRRLNGERKGLLIQFLIDSLLVTANITEQDEQSGPILSLTRAHLLGAYLLEVQLNGANLSGADLTGAQLDRSNLSRANLRGARLSMANLTKADLSMADLTKADLRRANLAGANLAGADLRWAHLSWEHFNRANLNRANLSGADLAEADLSGADLSGADLTGANLNATILVGIQIDDKTIGLPGLSHATR